MTEMLTGPLFANPLPGVREWVFTFGHGQRLIPPDQPDAEGLPLNNRYVRITGTFEEARTEMMSRFGMCWCAQYPNDGAAGVAEFKLRELL